MWVLNRVVVWFKVLCFPCNFRPTGSSHLCLQVRTCLPRKSKLTQVDTMKKILSTLSLTCVLAASMAAFAQDQMKQDDSKKGTSQQNSMQNDQMKKDTKKSKKAAKKDAMKKDNMKQNNMKDDNMKKDDTKNDTMKPN